MKNFTRILALLLALTLVPAMLFAGGAQEGEKTAKLTYVNWEEGVAYTHLVQTILEDEMGYDVTITAADAGPAYASVAAGDYDAFMEAWLPGLHASYMEELGDDLVDLGIIYTDAVSGLAIPTYMADEGVTTLSDLTRPEVVEKLGGQITGIDAGAGLMITLEEKAFPAYGFAEAGLELIPSSGPAMLAALDRAYRNEEYITVLGWQPHSMFGYFDLVMLEQDKEMIWDLDNIHIIGRTGIREDKPELAQFLSNMEITTEEVGALMVAITESNLDTLEAARQWKEENESVWRSWIPN